MIRSLLLQPRLFQAVSSVLQRRDKRRERVSKPWTPYRARVVEYNTSVGDAKITRTRRADVLYVMVRDRLCNADVLIVGPRDVHELYLAWCYGAAWNRLTGIDLVSNNPKILVRDMASTGFPAQSFDVIVASAAISYLESVNDGLREMYRVLRPGGAFAFTHTYDLHSEWHGSKASPSTVELWARDAGFKIASSVVRRKGRGEVMTCVLNKERI